MKLLVRIIRNFLSYTGSRNERLYCRTCKIDHLRGFCGTA